MLCRLSVYFCFRCYLAGSYKDAGALCDELIDKSLELGMISSAYQMLKPKGDPRAEELLSEHNWLLAAAADIGDEISIGSYEQDNDTGNGPEAIVWSVLDRTDTQVLLISKYNLESRPFVGMAQLAAEGNETGHMDRYKG